MQKSGGKIPNKQANNNKKRTNKIYIKKKSHTHHNLLKLDSVEKAKKCAGSAVFPAGPTFPAVLI